MPRQHCTNFPNIAQENSWANFEQKDKIVRNKSFPLNSTTIVRVFDQDGNKVKKRKKLLQVGQSKQFMSLENKQNNVAK